MSVSVGRNDPCPCGSGLKYKQCCQGKMMSNLRGRRGWLFIAIGVAVAALVVFGVWRSRTEPGGSRSPLSGPPGTAAQPWAYDSVSNRHYDPGHGHWHDGPPPSAAAQGGAAAPGSAPAAGTAAPFGATTTPGAAPPGPGATPAPWTYDEKNNQHWDPVHGHWHPGPPPAGAR